MGTELNAHLRNAETWKRGLLILIFAILYGIAEIVLTAIVLFQFVSLLITGKSNDKLLEFSRGLTAYFYQLLQFFTYRSDFKPYPFSDWPSEGLESVPPATSKKTRPAQTAAKQEPPAKKEKPGKGEEQAGEENAGKGEQET